MLISQGHFRYTVLGTTSLKSDSAIADGSDGLCPLSQTITPVDEFFLAHRIGHHGYGLNFPVNQSLI